ncbi:hypothetical protein [Roseivirga echinicomitans]|uniref:hypothetical protein n=1 Tax=Roseivirga echinicomitans TaxID=296218 RepID=UPI000AD5EEF7|nr:hypothetical protein [Roseivirga echinicomitans]
MNKETRIKNSAFFLVKESIEIEIRETYDPELNARLYKEYLQGKAEVIEVIKSCY